MSTDLELSRLVRDDVVVVTVGGEVDLGTANQLSEAAVAAMHENGPKVVLDLAGVTFMDSTGLKVLLAVHKRAELSGGRLVLASPTRSVSKVISVTGLDQTFLLCETLEAAVAACAGTATGRSA